MRTAAWALGCVFAVGGALWGQDAPLKVAEAAAKQAALLKVLPEYPTIARRLKLEGQVDVEALIDLDGKVVQAQIVRGNPVLGTAAVVAMKKWKFTPFVVNGKATRAATTITFEFRL
jgi:periplasmic protein TonB